ncbi:MAG: ATP synthase F1 subunit delta [Dehalococcoidia bacterium]
MPKQVAGKRYAQALFQLALEHGQADQWGEDLRLLAQVLLDPDFSAFLKHADVPYNDKVQALDGVLRDINPLVKNLGTLLMVRGAVDTAGDVQEGYARLLDDLRGRQQIEVTSAVALDDAALVRIQGFVSGLIQKEVVVASRVDDSILGGIIIQVGDQLLDGSTRTQLENMRKQLRSEVAPSSA